MRSFRDVNILGPVSGENASVDENRRLNVVQHTHPSSGKAEITEDGIAVGTKRYILVDLSDTIGFPHTRTGFVHAEWLEIDVDSSNDTWEVKLGFLSNVDGSGGDVTYFDRWKRSKAGGPFSEFLHPAPHGQICLPGEIVTPNITLGDPNYANTELLKTGADMVVGVAPGDGDLILEVTVSSGDIDFNFAVGYHTDDIGGEQ